MKADHFLCHLGALGLPQCAHDPGDMPFASSGFSQRDELIASAFLSHEIQTYHQGRVQEAGLLLYFCGSKTCFYHILTFLKLR